MKKLLSLVALASALIALPAAAQYNRSVVTTGISGGTNNVLNLATNTYSVTFDVSEFSNVGIQISGVLLSSNFCKPRLDFMTCVDGVNWCSTNLLQVTCLGGLSSNSISAGTFSYNTNVGVEGLYSLKLMGLANTDYHGIMSNVNVTVTGKKLVVR